MYYFRLDCNCESPLSSVHEHEHWRSAWCGAIDSLHVMIIIILQNNV